jgi:hypothetical protein
LPIFIKDNQKVFAMALEDDVKTGKDYVTEEAKELLKKGILQKADRDTTMNITLYEMLSTIINCHVQKQKQTDYELALALCNYYHYPKNAVENPNFEQYCQRTRLSKKEPEQKVRQFLGL